VRTWRSRDPDRLPPGVKVGRGWLYDKVAVELWLVDQRSLNIAEKAINLKVQGPKVLKRGKPRKEEVEAAKGLGLSVPAWRALNAGGVK